MELTFFGSQAALETAKTELCQDWTTVRQDSACLEQLSGFHKRDE